MEEKEILEKFAKQDKKLDAIFDSAEKTRKYFMWTLILNLVFFVLPLIGLIIIIPWFLKTMNYSSLGL